MRIQQLLDPKFIIPTYETRQSLHIMGPPGGGKSEIVRGDYPAILSKHYNEDFGICILDGPGLDAPDIQGFVIPTKDDTGKLVAMVTRSGHMPTEEYFKAHPRGMLVIEERNASDQLVQKGLNQVVLERRFGKHKLPDGWWVVSLSNRVKDKSGASKPMSHSINREMVVELDHLVADYITHWETIGLHPYGIACAKQNGGIFAEEVPKEAVPFCTARSFTAAWRWLEAASDSVEELNTSPIAQAAVAGYIGEGASATMFAYLSVMDELPTMEQILNDPKGAKVPTKLDATYMVSQNCVHHTNADTIDPIWTYVQRLSKEIQTATAQSCMNRTGGVLLNNASFSKWLATNAALVAATMQS